MPVGVGGGGYMGFAFETTMGTYVAPTNYVPILEEDLKYNEDKYYSPAIRQAVILNDVQQSFYSVGGTVKMEVDPRWMAYFLYCARLGVAKTGAGPWTYTFTPASGASSGIGAGNATQKTMSITMVRNNRVFKYVGCVLGGYTFMVEDGVLKVSMNVLGLGETGLNADTPPTPAFSAPNLFGAAAHQVWIDASGAAPTFASVSNDFSTFEFEVNDNGEAQNRIRNNRQASYISFGECEVNLNANIDFLDRLEFENFESATTKAFRLKSTKSTESVQVTGYRMAYDQYDVNLGAMGDIIIADVVAKGLNQTGGNAFDIVVVSATANIT